MTSSLDLILLPLNRHKNQDMPELPGLFATQAQGKVARGKALDKLVVHLTLQGNAPLSPKGYDKLVRHLGDIYYKTPGSSTSAMRSVAEWLNEYLLHRNASGAKRAMKSIGYLTLGVFRGNRFYLAQCGPVHGYLIAPDRVTHFNDSERAGRGLGLARAVHICYHQGEVISGDTLLISANPPPIWTKAVLKSLSGMALERMHQRLTGRTGPELQAALIQVEVGSGQLKVLRSEAVRTRGEILDHKRRLEKTPEKELISDEREVKNNGLDVHSELAPQKTPQSVDELMGDSSSPMVEKCAVNPQPRDRKTPVPQAAASIKDRKQHPQKERVLIPALQKITQAFGETVKQVFLAIGSVIKRMLPDETMFSVPTNIMAFTAFAVPIIVVAVAATVYLQRGRGKMYAEHYQQADAAADVTNQLSSPAALREGWSEVLSHLDNAEIYQTTEESISLREYAQGVLDNLDYVVRLPFQMALVGDLPKDAVIKRIVVTEDDSVLYLLNETDGHVFRTTRTERGYALDSDFICEPIPQPLIVGALVDIIPLPLENDAKADIMGMDANGNLLQCIPGGKPPLAFQMPPPDMNWGNPLAFVMNSIGLYVLDPITNAVWIFWKNDDFTQLPTLFFDEHVPPMGDVIDLTLNRDDLFLLHDDGHLTTCTFGGITRCEDPAMINDMRDGGERSDRIDNAVFSEIQFAPPPDPSLYLLEPRTLSIYHFSVRLTYQRQYRALTTLPEGPATAFTVSSNHQVFLAIGNQVFFSPLP